MLSTLELKVAAIAIILALLTGGIFAVLKHERSIGQDQVKAAVAVAQVEAQKQAQSEHDQTVAAQTEVSHVAALANAKTLGNLRAADAEHVRLLQRATSVGQSCGNPQATIAGSGEAAPAPLLVRADLLGRSDESSGIVALYADQLSTSLDACIGTYQSVK